MTLQEVALAILLVLALVAVFNSWSFNFLLDRIFGSEKHAYTKEGERETTLATKTVVR